VSDVCGWIPLWSAVPMARSWSVAWCGSPWLQELGRWRRLG
jgi:hypothetical protein